VFTSNERPSDLHLQYLPEPVLDARCHDLYMIGIGGQSPDPAVSRVYEAFDQNYDLAYLQALNLWENIDAKLATVAGGCDALYPWW
jgi:hypothetical protein